MYHLTLEYVPHGDESKKQVIGKARICNLMQHYQGSPLGSFHGYFDDTERGFQEINGFVYDYPRNWRSPWDLVADLLRSAERGSVTQSAR